MEKSNSEFQQPMNSDKLRRYNSEKLKFIFGEKPGDSTNDDLITSLLAWRWWHIVHPLIATSAATEDDKLLYCREDAASQNILARTMDVYRKYLYVMHVGRG